MSLYSIFLNLKITVTLKYHTWSTLVPEVFFLACNRMLQCWMFLVKAKSKKLMQSNPAYLMPIKSKIELFYWVKKVMASQTRKPLLCSILLHLSKLLTVVQLFVVWHWFLQWFQLNFRAGNSCGWWPGTSALHLLLHLTTVKSAQQTFHPANVFFSSVVALSIHSHLQF